MKKSLPLLCIAALIATGCSDIFDKQLEVYEESFEEIEDIDELPILMNEVLNAEMAIARINSSSTDEDIAELKEDYQENYELMCDSVETVRNRYYSRVDELFQEYIYNFVERRTLLYQIAADKYCEANCIEELNGIKNIIKRYSALSFVESQRACDPPAQIRKDYEATKELAENCFDVAKKRILENTSNECDPK